MPGLPGLSRFFPLETGSDLPYSASRKIEPPEGSACNPRPGRRIRLRVARRSARAHRALADWFRDKPGRRMHRTGSCLIVPGIPRVRRRIVFGAPLQPPPRIGVSMILSVMNTLRLRTRILLFMAAVCAVPLLFQYAQVTQLLMDEYRKSYADKVLTVARLIASDPKVIAESIAPGSNDPEAFYDYLDSLSRVSEVRYIVPMTMDGIRLYHPDRDRIGLHFVGGDEGRALAGESYVSSSTGTLGFSQRAFAPVYSPEGTQVGTVAVGVLWEDIERVRTRVAASLAHTVLVTLALGLILALLFSRSIKRTLLGLEPGEIAQRLEEHNAMLQLVNEGVVAIDLKGRITQVNDEALRILKKAGIDGLSTGRLLEEAIPGARLPIVMRTGEAEYDYEQKFPPITLLTNNMPLVVNGVLVGAISTFRDMSEVRALAEQITDIRRYADALRSQSHEFMNKLHAMLGLLHNGQTEALRSYILGIVDHKAAGNAAIYTSVKDPVVAGFMISKYAEALTGGVREFTIEGTLPVVGDGTTQQALITVLGNLFDNALDAVRHAPAKRFNLTFAAEDDLLEIFFVDSGCGMDEATLSRVFEKGFSTKGENRGFGLWLLVRTIDTLGGTIEVSSRPGVGTAFQICLPLPGKQE